MWDEDIFLTNESPNVDYDKVFSFVAYKINNFFDDLKKKLKILFFNGFVKNATTFEVYYERAGR